MVGFLGCLCGSPMSLLGLGCVKTSAREEGAELFSLLSSPDSVASVFVCQIDEVETKFLSANSISEFSHSLGPLRQILQRNRMSAFEGIV